jgi:Uma2 family endonuclease
MLTLVTDPAISLRLIQQRRDLGIDLFDEVWEGMYVMTPAPNDEHQRLSMMLVHVLVETVELTRIGQVRPAINLTSNPDDWEHDYRIPDAVVFLRGSNATCHDVCWSGSPDFVVEIVSPWDKTRDKIPFYEQIGVRELLIVDRDPWRLELSCLQDGVLVRAGTSTVEDPSVVASHVLPLSFRLVEGDKWPKINVRHGDGERNWLI